VEIDPAGEDDPVRDKTGWVFASIASKHIDFGEFMGILLENQRFISVLWRACDQGQPVPGLNLNFGPLVSSISEIECGVLRVL